MQNKKKPPMTMGEGAREIPGMIDELTGGRKRSASTTPAVEPAPKMTGKEPMSPSARRQMQDIQQRRAAQSVKPPMNLAERVKARRNAKSK